jgi:hypothetical protein
MVVISIYFGILAIIQIVIGIKINRLIKNKIWEKRDRKRYWKYALDETKGLFTPFFLIGTGISSAFFKEPMHSDRDWINSTSEILRWCLVAIQGGGAIFMFCLYKRAIYNSKVLFQDLRNKTGEELMFELDTPDDDIEQDSNEEEEKVLETKEKGEAHHQHQYLLLIEKEFLRYNYSLILPRHLHK